MVQRKINNGLLDLACHFTSKELIDVIGDYLREKRKKRNQDKFMNPQTYVCYRAVKDKNAKRAEVAQQFTPEPEGQMPPYISPVNVYSDEWWEGLEYIKPPINKEEYAYNRHS